MISAGLPRGAGLAGALALMLAPVKGQAAAAICPDAATVQAARVVEFQTMMMGVAVRCRHVGVPISDHLDGMNSVRRTMFAEANDRVASFLRGLSTKPAPGAASPVDAAGTPAPATLAKSPPGSARKAPPSTAATPALAAKPAAKISRRTDPFDRYLTMIGNQYGGGATTLQRCKAFDAIVVALGDNTNTDRLLTMVSSSLVQATLLEAIVNCPAAKK